MTEEIDELRKWKALTPRVSRWKKIADDPAYHNSIGYSFKRCERWWLVVRVNGRHIETWCGSYWLVGSLDDDTIVYDYRSARKVANDLDSLILNLSDYWRLGDVVHRKLQHPSSHVVARQLEWSAHD